MINMERLRDSQMKVAIYCRLSVDDGIAFSDSVSIQNQKKILTDFVNNKGWQIVDYYIDDGYSGTNFERPAFKNMIFDIECKKINAVITKDLSRLGRDHIKTGYYIEQYFPDNNVRYISVSDRIDTYGALDDFIAIKNVMNEFYAKDISKKVRFTIDNQMKSGKSIKTSTPLYGYMFDAKSNRIPNPDTAPTVRLIFDLFLEGNGYAEIAKILTEKQILTPQYYNYQKFGYGRGSGNNAFKHDIYSWSRKTVREIIINDEYIGNYRRGKTESRFKSKKKSKVDADDQYVFYDKYEPLISKDTFESAKEQTQVLMRKNKNGLINRYSGIIYCSVCHGPLIHKTDRRKYTKDFVRLTCKTPGCGPTRGTILYEDLDKVMKAEILKLKNVILEHKHEFLEYAKKKVGKEIFSDEKKLLVDELHHCEDFVSRTDKYIKNLYEQKVDGLISDSVYKPLIDKYSAEKNDLLKRIKSIKEKIDEKSEEDPNQYYDAVDFVNKIEALNPINCVEAFNLRLLISRIYVETDGKRKRREKMNKKITIIYRKVDNIIKEFLNENK